MSFKKIVTEHLKCDCPFCPGVLLCAPKNTPLTKREKDVLRATGHGLSRKEIAQVHGITEATVKNVTSRLYRKIGATSNVQAALYAVREGYV